MARYLRLDPRHEGTIGRSAFVISRAVRRSLLLTRRSFRGLKTYTLAIYIFLMGFIWLIWINNLWLPQRFNNLIIRQLPWVSVALRLPCFCGLNHDFSAISLAASCLYSARSQLTAPAPPFPLNLFFWGVWRLSACTSKIANAFARLCSWTNETCGAFCLRRMLLFSPVVVQVPWLSTYSSMP